MALCHARFLHALLTLLILLNPARALKNITIDNHNPRIQYFPQDVLSSAECQSKPENDACSGRWWTETTTHETFGPNTSLSFDFQGSALYFFGVTLDAGAHALASIDDNPPTIVEFSSPYRSPRYDKLIYSTTELDPGQQHTFHLKFFGPRSTSQNRRWMGVNFIIYTTEDDSTDLGDDLTASSAATATDAVSVPPTHSPGAGGSGDTRRSDNLEPTASPRSNLSSQPLNAATLAGIAAGVTCGVVFLLLVPLVVWLVRRRLGAQRVQSVALLRLKRTESDSPSPSPSPTPTPTPARRPSPYDPPDQRRYSAAFLSSASSPGAPVDERMPFVALTPPRIRRGPPRFLVHNPDASSRGTASHVGSANDRHG